MLEIAFARALRSAEAVSARKMASAVCSENAGTACMFLQTIVNHTLGVCCNQVEMSLVLQTRNVTKSADGSKA